MLVEEKPTHHILHKLVVRYSCIKVTGFLRNFTFVLLMPQFDGIL